MDRRLAGIYVVLPVILHGGISVPALSNRQRQCKADGFFPVSVVILNEVSTKYFNLYSDSVLNMFTSNNVTL